MNSVPPAFNDDGRATPPPMAGFPPKYTQAHYEDVSFILTFYIAYYKSYVSMVIWFAAKIL